MFHQVGVARCRDLIMQAITNGTNYTLDVELLESLRRQCARRAPGHSPAHVHVPGMKANLSVSLSSLKTDDATLSVTLESNGISGLPDTVYWDVDSLMSARKEPRSAATKHAITVVTHAADQMLNLSAYSLYVVNKPMTPPTGSKHDYMSVSSYDWPCNVSCNSSVYPDCSHWCMLPETLNDGKCQRLAHAPTCNMSTGEPWVSHDGYGNEKFVAQFDRPRADTITKAATMLTLAWWYTNSAEYLEQVTAVLRGFFLSAHTKMNPNMEFAQGGVLCSDWPTWPSCMKSITVGHSGGGVVDFARLAYILDAVALLEVSSPAMKPGSPSTSSMWTAADSIAMREWVASLLDWFMGSAMGHSGRLIQ